MEPEGSLPHSKFYVKRLGAHPVLLVSNMYLNKITVYTTVFIKVKTFVSTSQGHLQAIIKKLLKVKM
jgi:hypothetical protein